jgi:outer membrane protein OmpA-like peptidoglycan-associated protein
MSSRSEAAVTVRHRYDRMTRITLGVLVVLLIGGPVLALGNCVANIETRSQVVAPGHAMDDDRLVKLKNGATMLLDKSSLSPKVADWLKLGTDDRTAFEVADKNFAAGSPNPTAEGAKAISQVAQIMKADAQVSANIVVARDPSDDDALVALEQSRASRIDAELVHQGVPSERISTAAPADSSLEAKHVFDHPEQESRLFIVLAR